MKIACLALLLVVSLLVPFTAQAASQISPRDGLWLSLPPDSVKCIVYRLPQDAGLPSSGNYIFSVNVEPGPRETWSDLSEQIVREVNANNTVIIPICFDTAGANKPVGNCSSAYTITVSEQYTGTEKTWTGGTCVSERGDVDIVPRTGSTQPSPEKVLNDNTDVFAAWFSEERIYAKPGQTAEFNLTVQSSAGLAYTLLTQSDLSVTPASASLSTSPENPIQSQAFALTAPSSQGEYSLAVRVSPQGCQGDSYCTKLLAGTLVVSQEDPPRETGFRVTLRPENIDIREPGQVHMTLTIENNDAEERPFTSSLRFDPDDVKGWSGEALTIGPYESKTRSFILEVGSSSSLFEVTASVESQGRTSSATSFITVDELRTDALRQAEGLGQDSQAEVSSWLNDHSSSEYGSDLQSYGSLKDSLEAARAQQEQPAQNGSNFDWDAYQDYQEQNQEDPDLTFFLIPLIIVLGVAGLVAYVWRSRSSGREDESDYY